MENIVEQINKISKQVSETKLNQLRMEEELLINLAQNSKQPMKIKAQALARVSQINKSQLELLGESIGHSIPHRTIR